MTKQTRALIALIIAFPVFAFSSTFTDHYHGTFKGTYKTGWFGEKKECSLTVSYSHSEYFGNMEIRYHKFDVNFEDEIIEINGDQFNNDQIDNHLSERWFMSEYPHQYSYFEFSQYIGRKQYLVTNMWLKPNQDLESIHLYTKGARPTLGGMWGPSKNSGIICKNLKKVSSL